MLNLGRALVSHYACVGNRVFTCRVITGQERDVIRIEEPFVFGGFPSHLATNAAHLVCIQRGLPAAVEIGPFYRGGGPHRTTVLCGRLWQ